MKPHIVKHNGVWVVRDPIYSLKHKPTRKEINLWAIAYDYVSIRNARG
ncbi:hypothetical protein VP5_022 [Vibrio virus VPMCC5]|nr:hypothetical protein VP5_022 [Vibrio virus VPMCC5]